MVSHPLWTSREIALAVKGHSSATWYADGVAIDSREIIPGDVFIALEGQSGDGHRFVCDALAAGATGAIVSQSVPGLPHDDKRLLYVSDTADALNRLASAARTRMHGPVIAVTGSAGKTSVKEALRKALGRAGLAHASIRSFNNHVGVPLSLARMPRTATYAVSEIGMNGPGEIAPLSRIVRPHVAVITAIGAAHLQAFENEEAIAREKADIFQGLLPGGTAVFNMDMAHADLIHEKARATASRVIRVSMHKNKGDVYPIRMKCLPNLSCLTANVMGTIVTCKIGVPGHHWVMNALLSLAATAAVGGDLGLAALAMADMRAPAGRGRQHHIPLAHGSALLIDEAYNANPLSFAAALEVLKDSRPGRCGAKIAVLGDMEELGDDARKLHLLFSDKLKEAGVSEVIALGPHIYEAARCGGLYARQVVDVDAAYERLMKILKPGDVVLVKGANRAGLGKLVNTVVEFGQKEMFRQWDTARVG